MADDRAEINVYEGTRSTWSGTSGVPLEIGRQQEGDAQPLEMQDLKSSYRLVMAPKTARSIPRRALRVESDTDGGLRIVNIHGRLSFLIGDRHAPLAPGDAMTVDGEVDVLLPEDRRIRVSLVDSSSAGSSAGRGQSNFRTIAPQGESVMESMAPVRLNELFGVEGKEDRGRVAVDLVRSALTVVQKAAGTNEFFDSAVSAVATMIDLDRALVLLRRGDEWIVRASHVASRETTAPSGELASHSFSRGLTDRVLEFGKTVIYDPMSYMHTANSSMLLLDRAVAAPLFDEDRRVIGAIYGDRKIGSAEGDAPIGDLEAALLEVMAGAVSSGMARTHQEDLRANFTQFFSPAVADRLAQDEDLLAGRDAEVTVMFCDIRGFSSIVERVGAKRSIEWINDVLTELSQCVTDTDGVLVDYIGDEVMAMWGAPETQHDHAKRACTSAVEMLKRIEPLRRRWADITPDRFGVGIGINTGQARVGNTGSRLKFKYGPLGNTVNLASRVQGITKKLGVAALVTESTVKAVAGDFDRRRVAVVQPLGFSDSVSVHELKAVADQEWRDMASRYEEALARYESGELTMAAQLLASLVHDHPDDSPCVVLLGRVVDALTHREDRDGSVWVLDSK